jgi:tetratricopeptide (TPR) repeat protein
MNTNLNTLLKKDTLKIKELKSLLNSEYKYRFIFGAIEYSFGEEYVYENHKFSDANAIAIIKNLKANYTKDISFFRKELEQIIIKRLIKEVKKAKIMHYELLLVFDYILWSIDNRRWLNDPQAYVKWNAYHHGIMDDKENSKYRKELKKKCTALGIPKNEINAILDEDYDKIKIDTEAVRIESEYFSATDKTFFVLKNMLQHPYLIDTHGFSLEEEEKYDEAISFYKQVLEKIPEFPPIECSLGLLYEKTGNKVLAEIHITNAIQMLDRMPKDILPEEQLVALRKELNIVLRRLK